MKKLTFISLLWLVPNLTLAFQVSEPEILVEDVSIQPILNLPAEAVRLSFSKADSVLYFITRSGGIYSTNIKQNLYTEVQNSEDHGLSDVQGFEISSTGTFYLVGNNKNSEDATNVAEIMRATMLDGSWIWETVAVTEAYPTSNTPFDHIFNGIELSPDEQSLFINSGSRTDHGEVHDVEGKYPGLREAPLTAKILRLPADTINVLLKNDLEYLNTNGFVFAEGTRNSFSLAFDSKGNLFGTENSGDRDDPEELNWLREGHHYGFPWVMGGNKTPMQFSGYNPETDAFVPANSTAANLNTFYDDPDYPEPPEGVLFTSGVLNVGPDADTFRDSTDGLIKDASNLGLSIPSFSAHLSPSGLVFDTKNQLGGSYTGDGFLLGFSGGAAEDAFLLNRMNYRGEDLIHLSFTPTENNFEIAATSLVRGFLNPIDAEIIGNKVYLIEFRNDYWLNVGTTTRLYEVSFPIATNLEPDDDPPGYFKLNQNYPNPFNPNTVISFQLAASSQVRLEVFDLMGRKVSTLVNSNLEAGLHEVTFNAEGLSSGIYLYRIQAKGFTQSRRMLLLK